MPSGLLLLNSRIYTMDFAQPWAEAVAIQGSRIMAVGRGEDLRALAGQDWEVLDLGGRAVLPGFIDSHIHFQGFSFSLFQVNMGGAKTKADALALVAQRVKEAMPGDWIIGRGWDQNLWGRFPSKEDLDGVAPLNPVVLWRKDGHLVWVNSLTIRVLDIDRNTPDPPGGEIQRDERGKPTGILKEMAASLVDRGIAGTSPDLRQRLLRQAMAIAQSKGLVGIHDFEGAQAFSDFQELHERGELGLRVYIGIPAKSLEEAIRLGIKTGFGNQYLRLGPLKIFADGTLGSQTADMLEPYEGQPENRGIEVTSQPELERLVAAASQNDIACAIHAIGDRAVRRALDAIERAGGSGPNLRHRLEHIQIVHPQDLPRFVQLRVIASMQPIHATSDTLIADKYWGKRPGYFYAWRSLLASGTKLAFGSDAPVEDLAPIVGIHAAVTRQRADDTPYGGWYPQERLMVEEAVYGYTMGAAYASGEEKIRGSIAPGRLADLVVLSQDIFKIPPEDILQTKVVFTIFDGRIVYRATEVA